MGELFLRGIKFTMIKQLARCRRRLRNSLWRDASWLILKKLIVSTAHFVIIEPGVPTKICCLVELVDGKLFKTVGPTFNRSACLFLEKCWNYLCAPRKRLGNQCGITNGDNIISGMTCQVVRC